MSPQQTGPYAGVLRIPKAGSTAFGRVLQTIFVQNATAINDVIGFARKTAVHDDVPMIFQNELLRMKTLDICVLRIQKTGSTALLRILGYFCQKAKERCQGKLHYDWNLASLAKGVVTLLRHPVERTLSEFNFLRTSKPYPNRYIDQPQWDVWWFPPDVRESIWSAVQERNLSKYLYVAQNPSLNRQTLYLAGFKDFGPKDNGIIYLRGGRIASLRDGIDFKRDGLELLERAKLHLNSSKLTFGLLEYWECSLSLFSKAYGWPADKVIAMSRRFDGDKQRKQHKVARTWIETVDSGTRDEIIVANSIDMQLYMHAVKLFKSRARAIC